MWGLIGIDMMSRRMSLRGFLDGNVVLNVVLMVLTCLSIKHLDLGNWGEDVWCSMWWHNKN